MKGFEFTISQGMQTLYISNRPKSGFVSFIVAGKQPSLLDVKEKNIEERWDVTEGDFVELITRMYKKASEMDAEAKQNRGCAFTREVPDEEVQPKKKAVRKKV